MAVAIGAADQSGIASLLPAMASKERPVSKVRVFPKELGSRNVTHIGQQTVRAYADMCT